MVLQEALESAQKELGLLTQTSILQWIEANGIEKPSLANSTLYRKKPELNMMVDSYDFYSGLTYCYIAFMRNPRGLWLIKSLKKNEQPSPRAFLLASKLKEMVILPSGREEKKP